MIRLQERVKQADQAALRGNALMADGDYEQAMASFRDALALLPDGDDDQGSSSGLHHAVFRSSGGACQAARLKMANTPTRWHSSIRCWLQMSIPTMRRRRDCARRSWIRKFIRRP